MIAKVVELPINANKTSSKTWKKIYYVIFRAVVINFGRTKNSVRTRAGKPVFPQHFPSSPKTHDCSVYNVFERNPRKCCCFFYKTLRETEGKSLVCFDYKNMYSLFKKMQNHFHFVARHDRLLIIGSITVVIWICNDFVRILSTERQGQVKAN